MSINIVLNLCIIGGYVCYRAVFLSVEGLNVLNLTAVMIVGQVLRNTNLFRTVVPRLIFTAKIGIIADAIFAINRYELAGIVAAAAYIVWVLFPENPLYIGKKSQVVEIDSIAAFKTFVASSDHILVLCCDYNTHTSVETAHVFAFLSADRMASTKKFGLIDVATTDVASKLKISRDSVPTIISFYQGKEVCRMQVSRPSLKALRQKFLSQNL